MLLLNGKWKTKAKVVSLNPFTVCSSCKRKFVVCPFLNEETDGSYPFSNGLNRLNELNRLNGLAHLCSVRKFLDLRVCTLHSVPVKLTLYSPSRLEI
jgi:hypothetical protein